MQNLEFKGVEHFRIDKIIYFSHQTNLNHAISQMIKYGVNLTNPTNR